MRTEAAADEEWLAGCLGELEVRDCRVADALILQLKLEAVFRGTDVRCTESGLAVGSIGVRVVRAAGRVEGKAVVGAGGWAARGG